MAEIREAGTEAATIKDHAVEAAAGVKGKATSELASVAGDAREEARTVAHEVKGKLAGQADDATHQLSSVLGDASKQLRSMADNADDGPVTQVVRQLADRTSGLAERLDERGYRGVADDIARFGRNRPGVFLVAAGAVGFAVGRMLRNTDTQSIAQAAKGGAGFEGGDDLPEAPAAALPLAGTPAPAAPMPAPEPPPVAYDRAGATTVAPRAFEDTTVMSSFDAPTEPASTYAPSLDHRGGGR